MTITLPWTYIPMRLAENQTYTNSCFVLSFDGNQWTDESNCTIKNATDQHFAIIECNKFGTFGVRCITQPVEESLERTPVSATGPQSVTPSSPNVTISNHTTSSKGINSSAATYMKFSCILSALLFLIAM